MQFLYNTASYSTSKNSSNINLILTHLYFTKATTCYLKSCLSSLLSSFHLSSHISIFPTLFSPFHSSFSPSMFLFLFSRHYYIHLFSLPSLHLAFFLLLPLVLLSLLLSIITSSFTLYPPFPSLFTQSATEIYNTPVVQLTNCTFTNNTSKGEATLRNSGNAGAISIGYNDTYPSTNRPIITVSGCSFINNSARISKKSCGSATSALSSKVFVQRGGAIGIFLSAAGLQSHVNITKCWFERNEAEDSGGAIYMNLNGANRAVTIITITESWFMENVAMHGGGLEVTFSSEDSVLFPNHLTVHNCHFIGELSDVKK